MSSKRFNILANKGRSLYIHDYAQISAQVNILNNLRMKAVANIMSLLSRPGQNPGRIAVNTKFVDVNTCYRVPLYSLAKL